MVVLAVIMDLYSHTLVGWSMSDRMTATLVCDALTMAMFRRHRPTAVIVHSAVSPQNRICEQGLAPKTIATAEFDAVANYAYHLDAGKFAGFLQKH